MPKLILAIGETPQQEDMHQVAFLSALAEESTEKEPILDFGGFGNKTKNSLDYYNSWKILILLWN